MIEIIVISLLSTLFLIFLLRKLVARLWEVRACSPYQIEYSPEKLFVASGKEVKMLLLGDFGSGSDHQRAVARAMEKTAAEKGCDLVLLAGDNFIQKGITCVQDEQLDAKFESMYQLQLPFFAVLGNHDLAGNWKAQIEYTAVSERWNMPATNYDFTAGPVQVYAINTTCSVRTLWRLFKPSNQPWRLALGHHPTISSGRHGGMTRLERFVVSRSGIDFFVSGHNHALEHTVYRGIDQIVSGGGGSPIRKSARRLLPNTRFFREDFGYIWVHFTPEQACFHYFDISGKEIYTFTREKSMRKKN